MPPTSTTTTTTAPSLYLDVRPCTSIPYLVLITSTSSTTHAVEEGTTTTTTSPTTKVRASVLPSDVAHSPIGGVCESDDDVSQVLGALIGNVNEHTTQQHDTMTNKYGAHHTSTIVVDRSVVVSNRRVKLRIIPKLLLSSAPTTTTGSINNTKNQMVAITVRSSVPSQWTIKHSSVVVPMGSTHEVVVSLRKTLRRYELRSNLLITARVVREAEGVLTSPEESIRRGSTWKSQNVELDPKGPQVDNNNNTASSTPTLDANMFLSSSPSDVIHMVVPCVISIVSATPLLYDRLLLQYHKHQRNGPPDADHDGGDVAGIDEAPAAAEGGFSSLLLGGESEDSPSPETTRSPPQNTDTNNPHSPKVNLMRLVDRFVAVSKAAEKAKHRTIVPTTVAGVRGGGVLQDGDKRKSVDVVTVPTQSNRRSVISDITTSTTTPSDSTAAPATTTTTSSPITTNTDISPSELDSLEATLKERLVQINAMVDAANKEIHEILHNSAGGRGSGTLGKRRNPATNTTTSKVGKVLGHVRHVEGVLFDPVRAVWGWASQYNWAPMGLTLISLMLTWLIGISVASGRY